MQTPHRGGPSSGDWNLQPPAPNKAAWALVLMNPELRRENVLLVLRWSSHSKFFTV